VSLAFEPAWLAKRILRPFLSEQTIGIIQQTIGMLNYIKAPERGAGWGPFNGQTARQALFVDILIKTGPHAIVETGTSLGATTEFMSQAELPVFTIEARPRDYGFARARFWRKRNVKLLYGDSRMGLHKLFDGVLRPLSEFTIFFYLDAHWNDDLPLAGEIDIIFNHCPMAVVMIDDFEVPFDAGYGFDDYGPGKALVADYIKPAISKHQLKAFYPSTPSAADYPSTPMAATGLAAPGRLRRGCVVLVKDVYHGPTLAAMPLLRAATEAKPILSR
jgi:hypothetical protein